MEAASRDGQAVLGLPPLHLPTFVPGRGQLRVQGPLSPTGTDSGKDSSPRGSSCRACSHPGRSSDPFLARE